MRLLFPGRIARASRKKSTCPIQSLCRKSTSAAASRDPPRSPDDGVRSGFEKDYHYMKLLDRSLSMKRFKPVVDIHPGDGPIPTDEDPLKSFIRQQEQPNKIISRGADTGVLISSKPYKLDSASNLSPSILKLLDRRLYDQENHPINMTWELIRSVFPQPTYQHYVASNPVVTVAANFDVLGFPLDHPGRSRTDTYYVNKAEVLRTHTSAHQHAAFRAMTRPGSASGYTLCADVFRRDSIDRSHFPVFHQMEGARLWRKPTHDSQGFPISSYDGMMRRMELIHKSIKELGRHIDSEDPNPAFHQERNPKQGEHFHEEVRLVVSHLKRSLETLVTKVFKAAREAGVGTGQLQAEAAAADQPLKVRWVEAYFPFTSPSWELEVFWNGEWLELLGCGIVQQNILHDAGVGTRIGWAWGLGVERLAMLLFGIPDIRLFWSQDRRFLDQFQANVITRYEPFSRYPACYKDVAFWTHSSAPTTSTSTSTGGPLAESKPASTAAAAAAGGDSTKTSSSSSSSSSPAATQPNPSRSTFHENDIMEIVRDVAGSLAEDVKLVDEFRHPETGRNSLCYRINYRSLERTLTNEETNRMHEEVGRRLVSDLGVELRLK